MADGTAVVGRVAVTGATGFIGSAVVERLNNERDFEPVAVTRANGELGPATNWAPIVKNVDAIVHAAARVHVMRETSEDPLPVFRAVNVDGTLNLARQASEAGVKRFIFLSSIGVHGNATSERPLTETSPYNPMTSYAATKLEAEESLRSLSKEVGMPVVIIRPPLVYGPDAPGNFARLVRLVKSGLPLPFGRIANRRSLVSRSNLVDFVMTCLRHDRAVGETFLVSDGADISTPELVRGIAQVLEKPARLLPVPAGVLRQGLTMAGRGDMAQQLCGSLQADVSKARTILGWTPPETFPAGMVASTQRAREQTEP